jgi:uncharacterized protein
MQNEAKKTVELFLSAVQSGDVNTIVEVLDPAVLWSQPGDNRFSGIKRNAAAVFEMSAGWQTVSEGTFRLTGFSPMGINGNDVACLLHFNATAPGNGLDVDNIDIYTVRDNKIVAIRIFSLDQEQEDLYWGK